MTPGMDVRPLVTNEGLVVFNYMYSLISTTEWLKVASSNVDNSTAHASLQISNLPNTTQPNLAESDFICDTHFITSE
jgi:hypothetical protein